MQASRVLASSIPQTPRTRRGVFCPERIIPKAQGHLVGREGALSQEPPCTKQSPCPTVQTPGQENIRGSGMVRGAGMSGMGKTSQSQSLAAYCQEEWRAHAPRVLLRRVNALTGCTQTRWQERANTSWTGRKPSATGIPVSFRAVSDLRAAQDLDRTSALPDPHLPTSHRLRKQQNKIWSQTSETSMHNSTTCCLHFILYTAF